MFNSIKLKLVILFLAVFSLFFAGIELFLYYKLEEVTLHLADEHLRAEVNTLANLMAIEEAQGQLESELQELATAVTGVYAEKLSGHYYQIVSQDGKVLVRSPSLSLAGASLPVMAGTQEGEYRTVDKGPNDEPVRVISLSFDFSLGKLTFQAAETLEDTYELLGSFRNIVLAIFPFVFIVCAIGVYAVTSWALNSLKTFSAKIGQITEENLSERVEERGAARELKPLAANFNTMLSRLENSWSRQKQFLSDASHELRTPTSIIKSYCDVTLGRERQAGEYRDAIKKIGDTVNRMCDIINRILVISRLDNKTIQLKPVRMDIKDVMRDILKLIEPSASGKGIEITLEGGNPSIRGDREGLTEVFTNIIENAIKYNKPDGKVAINIGEESGWAVVSVEDTGIGIAAFDVDKIFDRFYRVDASRGVTVGSGIGLSIVKTIVEAHGGRIEVRSEPGKGSAFTVFLPKRHEGNGAAPKTA
ncbi:MAG: sensor histidine kinase N-terminal domain-containing protein [Deltaproteobacteria bacterium]|nr:sensor histidine kinase N-terminal domain-containing protein [Deltaproteobacteria bacterium]